MIETTVTLRPDLHSPSPQPGDIGEVTFIEKGNMYVYWRRTETIKPFPLDRLTVHQVCSLPEE